MRRESREGEKWTKKEKKRRINRNIREHKKKKKKNTNTEIIRWKREQSKWWITKAKFCSACICFFCRYIDIHEYQDCWQL